MLKYGCTSGFRLSKFCHFPSYIWKLYNTLMICHCFTEYYPIFFFLKWSEMILSCPLFFSLKCIWQRIFFPTDVVSVINGLKPEHFSQKNCVFWWSKYAKSACIFNTKKKKTKNKFSKFSLNGFLFSNCLLHLPSNSENRPLHVYAPPNISPRSLYFEIASNTN